MGVPLNLDAGELPDEPEELYALADLVNVACGGHAGDEASMARVVRACVLASTGVGGHPSYVDREGFGRVSQDPGPVRLRAQVAAQLARLRDVAAGVPIRHVKPHGALYHDAHRDPVRAAALLDGAIDALGSGFSVVGPRGGALARAAADRGLSYLVEGFADRALGPDGALLPRGHPGALLTDPAAAAHQARTLRVDTVGVHADTPGALAIVRAVRAALDA